MLQDKVTSLRGVGEKTKNFLKKLDIETIEDLLRHCDMKRWKNQYFFIRHSRGRKLVSMHRLSNH